MFWKIILDDAGRLVSIERVAPLTPPLSRLALGPHPQSLSDLLLAIARQADREQASKAVLSVRCESCGRRCERSTLSSIARCTACMADLGY